MAKIIQRELGRSVSRRAGQSPGHRQGYVHSEFVPTLKCLSKVPAVLFAPVTSS